jgi:hypothetical protein
VTDREADLTGRDDERRLLVDVEVPARYQLVDPDCREASGSDEVALVDQYGIAAAGHRPHDDEGNGEREVQHAGDAAAVVVREEVRPDKADRVEIFG